MVYILNKDNKPLMPTTRHGHIRYLLKTKQARVVDINPFTIQLLYDTDNKVQDLYLGIDPGRTNIGLSVIDSNGKPVYKAIVETRNKEIPNLMKARKAFRNAHRHYCRRKKRQRRAIKNNLQLKDKVIKRVLPQCKEPITCKYIKNKEAKFNNRKRPSGWLTPTANQLLQTHLNIIEKIKQILPINNIVLEVNKFAFMELDNPNIQKWEYQNGPLKGCDSVYDAIDTQQGCHCLLCKKPIEHYHHIIPKHCGGSDTIANLVGLCLKHHDLVHTNDNWKEKLNTKRQGQLKKYGALSVLNQIIPFLVDELQKQYSTNFYVTNGQNTYDYREYNNIPKNHDLDAYCIAASVIDKYDIKILTLPSYRIKQFRRHDRQVCHKQNINRVYLLNGKKIAVNRHRAFEQKELALDEILKTLSKAEISQLKVKEHRPINKNRKRSLPGSKFICNDNVYVLKGSDGSYNGHPNYYIDINGNKHLYNKCKIIKQNGGLIYV